MIPLRAKDATLPSRIACSQLLGMKRALPKPSLEHAAFVGSLGSELAFAGHDFSTGSAGSAADFAVGVGVPVVVTALALARCARRRETPWRTLAPLTWAWLAGFVALLTAPRPTSTGTFLLAPTFAVLVCAALIAASHLPLQVAHAHTSGPTRF